VANQRRTDIFDLRDYVSEMLEMLRVLRDLGNGIYAKGASAKLRNPEAVRTALDGASALLSPAPMNTEGASRMVNALKHRYGLK
jgi:hypothetical protein